MIMKPTSVWGNVLVPESTWCVTTGQPSAMSHPICDTTLICASFAGERPGPWVGVTTAGREVEMPDPAAGRTQKIPTLAPGARQDDRGEDGCRDGG